MKLNNLHIEHPRLSIGQLFSLSQRTTLDRSSHVGNQPLCELALLTNLPIQPIMVDTIHGRDRYSRPAELLLGGGAHRLASNSQANDRIVGKVPANVGTLKEVFKKQASPRFYWRPCDAGRFA